MDCIICLTPLSDGGTIEHVMPDSIGGTLTLPDVCSSCNSLLGTRVDSALVNNFFVATERARLRLPGKAGEVPNPFEDVILTDDQGNHYRYHLGPDGKPKSLELVPRKEADSDGHTIRFWFDGKDKRADEKIVRFIERQEKQGVKVTEVDRRAFHEDFPRLNMTMQMSTFDWQPAILKIAYELAYLRLGPVYLNDPVAVRIRTLFQEAPVDQERLQAAKIQGAIQLVSNAGEQVNPLQSFCSQDTLLAAFVPTSGAGYVYVNIFNLFEGRILAAEKAESTIPPLIYIRDLKRQTEFKGNFDEFFATHRL